ncbi:hypothetical protein CPB84DRAFT_563269 [Gymnopilus junonius]|uniref:Ankyrin repeat protein n=1 Tax=Gymnopilus junonius TaxID=109634 RepID=A0A9P5NVM6_GYMJU|nr:hypothetical protein CPB84DRAFT_563269 [Gymnopilus junonius]
MTMTMKTMKTATTAILILTTTTMMMMMKTKDTGDTSDEEEDRPDIIVIDELDWDLGFSALSYAIIFASLPTLEALLGAGADISSVTKSCNIEDARFQPLSLCILREDQDEACVVAERLIKAGASSSSADDEIRTILHIAIFNGCTKLVETLLKCDPNAKKVVNFPALVNEHVTFPIVTAINKKHYGLVALLLAHGAKLKLDEKDITPAQQETSSQKKTNYV